MNVSTSIARRIAFCWVVFVGLLHADLQPPTGTWRIVCLGDSITQSNSNYKGYRYELWKDLIDAGIPFDYVGSYTTNFGGNPVFPNYQGRAFDRHHEGHWAWDTLDILNGYVCNETLCPGVTGGQLSTWLAGYTPDIALIHLGLNDLFRGWSTSTSVGNLTTIINSLRADNPNVAIFLSQIINTGRLNEESINSGIGGMVSLSTAQSPVIIVDNYAGFDAGDLQSDNIHPNDSGALKMAEKFGAALLEYINSNAAPTVEAGPNQTLTWPQVTTTLSGQAADDGSPDPPASLSVEWKLHAGPGTVQIHQPNQLTSSITLPSGGNYWFKLVANDGGKTAVDYVLITILDGGDCAGQPIILANEFWTLFGAESFSGYTAGTGAGAGYSLAPVTEYHGYSGELVMQSLPATGVNLGDAAAIGGRLDYAVSFPTSGVWYAWVRMYASVSSQNSIHFGLNGGPISLAGGGVSVEAPFNTWQWLGSVASGATRLALNVPTRGIHQVNVWMRESGSVFDAILLTQDPNAMPDGAIPTIVSLGNYCDLDGDTLPDAWETSVFGSAWPLPAGDFDHDHSPNGDEYIAGTAANNGADYPMLMTELTAGGVNILIPSVPGRLYDVAFTRNISAAEPVWESVQTGVSGITGTLSVPHLNPPSAVVYRSTVRLP